MSLQSFIEHEGECILFLGPMFSGKSTRLCGELTTCADLGHSVLYINHSSDVRKTEKQDTHVTTHHSSFRALSDKITKTKINELELLTYDLNKFDVIGVDEGQFFSTLETHVRHWVLDLHKIVYIASLDGDFRIQPFGQVHKLLCISSHVLKLKARCMLCKNHQTANNRPIITDAYYTGKIGGDMTTIVDVGGEDKYLPVCLSCHKGIYHEKFSTPAIPINISGLSS